ncbi:hypothetical protein Taro_014625 [Colocasia esculenta]|uniref:Uncharacterized protein n=1 Tax=Colocasia esculenta TaxID=4460 RepID=A0A843UF28_COLES|nr:hypothetical protein [Colocasia esculenta]
MKIGAGVREGWQRRREMLLLQETCCFEWQNIIAEASRKGYYSDEELHWDSYETLDKQLEKEWLESVEERKTTRPKGTKRAPKSLEQRRKIAQAIAAKWADPAYRDRVCSGLAKYHGILPGAERKRRRKPIGERQSAERKTVKKKDAEPKQSQNEVNLIKEVQKKRKSATPSYKDPMASSKLEMIKKIREQRATIETKKREATERAKLLIAEAEKAAKALEVAALKSPLARASLLETRKLIAEAARSIERIEGGQLASKETGDNTTLNPGQLVNHSNSGPEAYIDDRSAAGQQGNSRSILSSNERNNVDADFNNFSKQSSLNGRELLCEINGTKTKTSAEGLHEMYASLSLSDIMQKHSDMTVTALQLDTYILNGSSKYNDLPSRSEDQIPLQVDKVNGSVASITITKKKWVRGRLVEVEED